MVDLVRIITCTDVQQQGAKTIVNFMINDAHEIQVDLVHVLCPKLAMFIKHILTEDLAIDMILIVTMLINLFRNKFIKLDCHKNR